MSTAQPVTCIRVLGQLDADRLATLHARCPDLAIRPGADGDAPAEVVFAWDRDPAGLAAILARQGSTLRWVHFRRVGVPTDLLRLFEPHPHVALTNGRGASGPSVAEYVVAVTLALYRRLPELRDRQQRADWARGFHVAELRGQTACIVGLGDLGRSTARLLRPFGVRLLGVRRQAEPVPEVDETHPPEALPGLLERTNLLILAAPLTPETRHLIGAAELARLPRGAYLVNVGRGPLLDEAALADALRSGHLAGAALDVFAEEPLPPTSPLWSIPSLIITPHTSTHTDAVDDRNLDLFLDNLARFRRGQPLLNLIDRGRGY